MENEPMTTPSDRRRFLSRFGYLTAGAALGVLLPRWSAGLFSGPADKERAGPSPEEQLRKLKLKLPPVPKTTNTRAPAVRVGNMLYVSGHGPGNVGGKPVVGKLGKDYTVKQGQEAARLVGLQILGVVR